MRIDSGNTAWVLASSALVLFMTPGLAFFYGGMVRTKNVLGMLMQNYVVMGIVRLLWALITGSTADRLKFGGFVAAITLWAIFVYAPVAHWVFSPTGWLFKLGAEDFAGGTVVHLNAGIAGVALALVVGRRRHWPKEPMPPHSLPLTLLGAGMLWFGWFGFNAGSAPTSSPPRPSSTPTPPPLLLCWVGRPPRSCATASRPRWAPPPERSPAWWRSPRPVATSTRWAPSPSG